MSGSKMVWRVESVNTLILKGSINAIVLDHYPTLASLRFDPGRHQLLTPVAKNHQKMCAMSEPIMNALNFLSIFLQESEVDSNINS